MEESPTGPLTDAICERFGDFRKFVLEFTKTANSLFGSGWLWLAWDGTSLRIQQCPNQDGPIIEGHTPLLGLDVWEHAYYPSYRNRRNEYVEAWWDIVHWSEVGRGF